MKSYIVNEEDLKNLINQGLMLRFLIYAGVDNWLGYEGAMQDHFAMADQMISDEIKRYPEFIEKEDYTLWEE